LVKQDKQVLAYLTELLEMEALFYEQVKKISKATALLRAIINGEEFTKKDVSGLLNQAQRAAQMEQVYAMSGKLDFTDKKGKGSKAKAPKDKDAKPDTKELSLELFQDGKSISEIAAERKMAVGTIEGHLAHYVALQEIDAVDILGAKKLEKILQAIKVLQPMNMTPIRSHLGNKFSFGEIKIGVAAHLADRE